MRRAACAYDQRRQRGAALLLFVIALVLASTYALLKQVNGHIPKPVRDARSTRQLGQARAALLGYALAGKAPSAPDEPGRFPCPDYDLDGISDSCQLDSGHVVPGRLPWVTLGLAELRDAANEPLWYVPAPEFYGNQSINSDSHASLRLDGSGDEIVALVLSPGAVLSGQSRPAGLPYQLQPGRYFEGANAIVDNDYVSRPAGNGEFNDQVLAIRLDDFIPALERRVLRELGQVLASGPFPNPATIDTTACDNSLTQGLLPTTIDTSGALVCDTGLPPYPAWFVNDGWQKLVWYAVDGGGALSVAYPSTTTTGIQALLLAPGRPIASLGQNRSPADDVADLLDSAENRNMDTVFDALPASASYNDQVFIVAP